jgi:predicted nucleotidyltransferase
LSTIPASPSSTDSSLPPDIARVLDDFARTAREALGETLEAIVLFGSAADGTLAPTSDVNVILVLRRFDRERVDRLRDALRVAQAAIRLAAMFLLREEIPAAATAFAQKFADIARRRRLLHGPDPFADLVVPRGALVTRLDQVLLNLALRLRAAYVERSLRPEQLGAALSEAAGPLATSAASLTELEGRRSATPAAALRAIGAELCGARWDEIATALAQARRRAVLAPGVAGTTVLELVELVTAMRRRLAALR